MTSCLQLKCIRLVSYPTQAPFMQTACRGDVVIKGKGRMVTYWLLNNQTIAMSAVDRAKQVDNDIMVNSTSTSSLEASLIES